MNKKTLYVACWILSLSASAVAQMSAQQAMDAGKASGSGASVKDLITGAQGSNVIRNYGAAVEETSYYQGGQGSLAGPATARVNDCSSLTSFSSPEQKNACEAVNLIAKQPEVRPALGLTRNDPLIVSGKAITDSPQSLAQQVDGTYSACSTETVQNPDSFVLETCDEISTSENTSCTVTQEVIIDPDYLYSCKVSLKSFSSSSCYKNRSVLVDATHKYQCSQTVNAYETLSCNKIANVTLNTSSTSVPCSGIIASIQLNQYGGTGRYNYRISCTANPDIFSIYMWTSLNNYNCTPTTTNVTANNVYTTVRCYSGTMGWYNTSAKISCVGASCTLNEISDPTSSDKRYTNYSFIRSTTITTTTATVIWDDQCTTLDQRTQ